MSYCLISANCSDSSQCDATEACLRQTLQCVNPCDRSLEKCGYFAGKILMKMKLADYPKNYFFSKFYLISNQFGFCSMIIKRL